MPPVAQADAFGPAGVAIVVAAPTQPSTTTTTATGRTQYFSLAGQKPTDPSTARVTACLSQDIRLRYPHFADSSASASQPESKQIGRDVTERLRTTLDGVMHRKGQYEHLSREE
eukprot:1653132-Prorocentrum_lima.AAC.1